MSGNEPRRYVVKKRDPNAPKPAGDTADRAQGLVDRLVRQWPAVAGIGCILMALVVLKTETMGYVSRRAAAFLFAMGIAGLGYWAFASNNENYHF